MIEQAIALLNGLNVEEKILVTTETRLMRTVLPPGIRCVLNGQPIKGLSESVRLGVEAAKGTSYLFMTADQPRLTQETLRRLLALSRENPDKIVFPSVGGNPCTPIVFPAWTRAELLAVTGDAGGRTVREKHPAACLPWHADVPEEFFDIDCLTDYMTALQYNRNEAD